MARLTERQLTEAVSAYYDNGGVKSDAARSLGLARRTYMDRLSAAQKELGIELKKVVEGKIHPDIAAQRKLPLKGHVKHYLLTSAQNNTSLHMGFNNLIALADWLNHQDNTTCELMVGTYTYNTNAYGKKSVKQGTKKTSDDSLWYAPELKPYISDKNIEIAPGLVWCGHHNILPTAKFPLTGLESFNGRKSNIVPHATVQMDSIASMPDEPAKFNYSTGTVTQRNYIQKRAGIVAEQRHKYSALIASVNSDGDWYVRQLYIGADDEIMDIGPDGSYGILVQSGEVHETEVVEYIYWGDVHECEADEWAINLAWGKGGMVDQLRPSYEFVGDIFSMRAAGHHEIKSFHQRYAKRHDEVDIVEAEVESCAAWLTFSERDFSTKIVIHSNHDRHLNRWLDEADPKKDLVNAKYYHWLQYHFLDAIDKDDTAFNLMAFALQEKGCPESVYFLSPDESYNLEGTENSLHGDISFNGARGSTRGLVKLGIKLNKGHDHTAAIRDGVFSCGAMALTFAYMAGPSSHSISQIVGYKNGERAIVTFWKGRFRV